MQGHGTACRHMTIHQWQPHFAGSSQHVSALSRGAALEAECLMYLLGGEVLQGGRAAAAEGAVAARQLLGTRWRVHLER